MPYPYDVLSAAAYPAVTNARASGWEKKSSPAEAQPSINAHIQK